MFMENTSVKIRVKAHKMSCIYMYAWIDALNRPCVKACARLDWITLDLIRLHYSVFNHEQTFIYQSKLSVMS